MKKAIEDYIRNCDSCQRRKGDREFVAPLGQIEEGVAPFAITAMDITGAYLQTPRGNKNLLTFIDYFSKYVEAYPISDPTASTCAKFTRHIVMRHGTGSQLITDQGRAFMSSFFQETCKLLGIRRTRTTALHPSSNGQVEGFNRSLHTGLPHYIDSSHTNWDILVPFYLMAYRATPNSVTGYSPFYLLHGREMEIPNNDSLKARVASGNPDVGRRLENLKTSLRKVYKFAAESNRKSRQRNKKLYDRKAKVRHFSPNDLVYLYNPALKAGLTQKFRRPWTGPYKITKFRN
jgi:hypothetical protein